MIEVKAIYIGNDDESYIQKGLTKGVNIITSDENHVGKTIVMQSIMYAMGSDALFPPSFKDKHYVFIVDLNVDGREISILRSRDYFVVNDGRLIVPLEGKGAFDEYWNQNISPLPTIVKDGVPKLVGLTLFLQMAFVTQASRNTSRVVGSYFDKKDFIEMVFAVVGLDARQMDSSTEADLKRRKAVLDTRKRELLKQSSSLRQAGTSLAAISPTADREETARFVAELDRLRNQIAEQKKQRNHAYTRMKKNEAVLAELRSLNREIKVGSVVCLECGSEAIGYKMPSSDFAFDITTDTMRKQILLAVQEKIDAYSSEIDFLEKGIRELQSKFNALTKEREITLEDIYAVREDYGDVEKVDHELTSVCEEIDEIKERLRDAKRVDEELREERVDFKTMILDTMNSVRRTVNDDPNAEEYTDLLTTAVSQYMGSEATEFYIARVYSLAKHVQHGLPVLIDSFRAEELSSAREERALPFFESLPNQIILTATLKGEEAGKYRNADKINNIDFAGYTENKLLSEACNEAFKVKVGTFGVELNV